MVTKIRLQKYIRDLLGMSRRKSDDLIAAKKVQVNGVTAKLGQLVDPQKDTVTVEGKELRGTKKLTYILLNKPAGYLTTRYDPHNPNTVYDLLPKDMNNLFPVGRLDRDTEGLLILTNDGDLSYQLTHPKHEIEKEYFAIITGKLLLNEKKQIEGGINDIDLHTSPAKVKVLRQSSSETQLNITLHEGQKREIRRIFAYFGHNVKYLKRTRVKSLKLEGLEKGKWRTLIEGEVKVLFA